MTDRPHVRPMQADDIEPVLRIQAHVYPATLLEDAALFQNRLEISPGTCQVAEGRAGLLGYLVASPWLADPPPALHTTLEGVPRYSDSWSILELPSPPSSTGIGT